MDIPFLGEIPFDRSAKGKPEHIAVSVGEQSRDMLSEAFRILRTNMTFMMKHDRSPKVIAVTSVNEGAGKTFTSMNLAASFAFAKKKVVIVDLDIRKGTLSRMFHGSSKKAGVTDYIANGELTADDILIKGSNQSEMDIIPAGCMAPNPTELLMDGRLDELFSELRKRYERKLDIAMFSLQYIPKDYFEDILQNLMSKMQVRAEQQNQRIIGINEDEPDYFQAFVCLNGYKVAVFLNVEWDEDDDESEPLMIASKFYNDFINELDQKLQERISKATDENRIIKEKKEEEYQLALKEIEELTSKIYNIAKISNISNDDIKEIFKIIFEEEK